MNNLYFEDIICARGTPAGSSAIAIIRVSGKNSWEIIKNFFSKKRGYKSHHAYYGKIIEKDNIIDEVILTTFQQNKSFTGEESFEINCHGSEVIISLIINVLLKNNIRLAEPGEFTKRAFLNGKIDLTKAESIMDVINASTKKSALNAVRQLSGQTSTEINKIKNNITNILSEIEVYIDYPEEDLTIDTDKWISLIQNEYTQITKLLSDFQSGKFLREGIRAVILGKTNSGKSTLFNLLLNEDKAIVSDIHGTTRDFLDGIININGYGIRIFDTAGLRKTDDPIEMEGNKKALNLSEETDFIFYVISASEGLTKEDEANILKINTDKKIIFIINKIDLAAKNDLEKQINNLIKNDFIKYKTVKMSALEKRGLESFNTNFMSLLTENNTIDDNDPVITNVRHAQLLDNAQNNLVKSLEQLKLDLLDLGAFELREALDNLGEITGEVTTEDILTNIFSNFCVGK